MYIKKFNIFNIHNNGVVFYHIRSGVRCIFRFFFVGCGEAILCAAVTKKPTGSLFTFCMSVLNLSLSIVR